MTIRWIRSGDVFGPDGGVADGELMLFDGTTGKVIKGSGVSSAQLGELLLPSLGQVLVTGNTATTTINTVNVWEDVELGLSPVLTTLANNFALTDTATGELQYQGLLSLIKELTLDVTVSSMGSADEFEFQLLRNGSALLNLVIQGSSVGNNEQAVSLHTPVPTVSDDFFRAQVRNTVATTDCLIKHFSMFIR